MKQAILITAYKNVKQINDIINYFGEDFNIYIHIDKKASINFAEVITGKNIYVYSEYLVNWGSLNHLKAILFLANKALDNAENGYFHLITGQDFPVKSKYYFLNEFDTTNDYLEYFELPTTEWLDGGLNRLEYYYPYEIFDNKTLIGKIIIRIFLDAQKLFKVKRKIKLEHFERLYGGGTYWSLTRESLQYVLHFTDRNKYFLNRMKFTFCAEEIYFQTILLNSKHINNIVNDNLRYIDWDSGSAGSPPFLDETYYTEIQSSDKIFARKFHEVKSEKLKQLFCDTNNLS